MGHAGYRAFVQERNMAASKSRAPEFSAGLEWFNVEGPVRLADQAGRIVLLVFGAWSSVYCQRVLQDLQVLGRKYRDDLLVISVHTPRYAAERKRSHVLKAISKYRISHPVVHDPEKQLWNMYGIKAWPTQVLVDREGMVLGSLSGDGKLAQLDLIIKYQIEKITCLDAPVKIPAAKRCMPETTETPGALSFPGRIIVSDNKTYIADSAADILSSRLMVLNTAWIIDPKGVKEAMKDISIIKFYVANAMQRVIDRALQVHGGLGMCDDTPIAMYYQSERAARIYDGTDEVHKISVGRRILNTY